MLRRLQWGFFVASLCLVAGLVWPVFGSPQSFERVAIREMLEAQAAAWNNGDLERFMAGYWKSDETLFVGSSGVFRGWQEVLDRYRRTYPDRKAMGRLTFSGLEIHLLSADAAYIVGHWQLERDRDRPGGVFTLIARKFPDGWRIILDHTSALATPEAQKRE